VDAEHQRRNPTRYVPDQPGFLSLSRAEAKQDLRELAGADGAPSTGHGGPATYAKESDGVMNTEWHKLETTSAPQAHPGSNIGIKAMRLRRWARDPVRAKTEVNRCTDQVNTVRSDLHRAMHQQTQSEEQYLALREHHLVLLQMLREAGQGHDVYAEEMGKACLRLAEQGDPGKRKSSDSSSAFHPKSSEGKALLEAAITLGKGIDGLKGELKALEEEEAALLATVNGASPTPTPTKEGKFLLGPDTSTETSFWGAGTKSIPAVGDFVNTAYGQGFVTKVRVWDGFVRLAAPIAEVELTYGKAYLSAEALGDCIREPGDFSDLELAQKWSRHRRLMEKPDVDSIANLNAESYTALTMDDFGLPFEADDTLTIQASGKIATKDVFEVVERILPGAKKLRQSRPPVSGQLAALGAIFAKLEAEAAKGDDILQPPPPGALMDDFMEEDEPSMAQRTRGRRPRRYDPTEGTSETKADVAEDTADANAAIAANANSGEGNFGYDGMSRSLDEQVQRCRERLFPLTSALLPHEVLPTGRSRLALQRLPLCALDERPTSAHKGPFEEALVYGGAVVVPPDGSRSIIEHVERVNPELRELADRAIESFQFRSEIAREHSRRQLLPKFFHANVLKRVRDSNHRKNEVLKGNLQDLVAAVCPDFYTRSAPTDAAPATSAAKAQAPKAKSVRSSPVNVPVASSESRSQASEPSDFQGIASSKGDGSVEELKELNGDSHGDAAAGDSPKTRREKRRRGS